MAYFIVPENPEYSEEIRKLETTDPGHADVFNETLQKLVNNDAFLKAKTEGQFAENSATNITTLWSGIIYENSAKFNFYVPEQYWHNDNLTLMIDCVKYQQNESELVMPPHSKTVMAALTRPHTIYINEDGTIQRLGYSASYNSDEKINKCLVHDKFSNDSSDIIDISIDAKPLTTTDYAEVSVSKSDTNQYVITDIYAVIPQPQKEE